MKKIALIAALTLGLAACGDRAEDTNTVNTTEDYNVTVDNTLTDVNAAATDVQNAADAALDNAGAAIDNAGEAVENAAEAVETNGM